ncbi:MAG TPA: hypothetical protein GXX37_12350 [Clostridiaceae bacterium]|nr:hypothetical protein [Clostridiaceae bacterium]
MRKFCLVSLAASLVESLLVLVNIESLGKIEIKIKIGGINHFFWVTEINVRGKDGYEILRHKMKGRSFKDLVTEVYVDGAGFSSNKWVASELFDYYGYLPYVADRHICEFLPQFSCL